MDKVKQTVNKCFEDRNDAFIKRLSDNSDNFSDVYLRRFL